jgi:hypothetical protein
MEVKDLLKPAEKRLDLTEQMGKNKFLSKLMGSEEFVTLRRFPAKTRYSIQQAALKGYNEKFIRDKLLELRLERTPVNINKILSDYPREAKTPEWDDFSEYALLQVEAGINPDKHSFTIEGKTKSLDRVFWESIQNENPKLFAFVLKAVNDYQAELDLGE